MGKRKFDGADRYGGNYPDVKTVCKGPCEGMGVVPVYMQKKGGTKREVEMESEKDLGLVRKWKKAEKKAPADDGWHFVTCPSCEGSGKRK